MAWVRRVRTASGATAVQIAESVDGRRRIVAHVGSAHTEVELGLLLERAREMLRSAGQGELDLDVDSSPRRVRLVSAATDPAVLPGIGPVTPPVVEPRVAPAKVVATSSRLLYDVLADLYSALGLDVVADEVFRDLVIARVVEPTSIMDTGRVLTDLGRTPVTDRTMRRSLGRAQQRRYRERVAAACFGHAARHGDLSLCLYDVTTLYFEAENEDPDAGGKSGLRKVGYSKERRVDPQIVVGLLVDRYGFPLEVGCFEGNRAETTTILPIVEAFQARHGLAGLVIVADAGMLSASNLRDLDDAGLRFIVGSRVTKAPADLESHFRWHGDAFTDGQVIDTITPKTARASQRGVENDINLKAEPVWDPAVHVDSWRAVWAYSTKRAVRDNKTITLQENKAKEVVAGQRTAKTPRFVKTSNGAKSLDEASLARARRLVGLKGYVSNIDAATMPAPEVIASYHDLWHVEQSFRMSKTDLRARPMFAHTRDAIEAHLTIVFTALAISRELQNRTGLALRNVVRQLRPLRSATIAINGSQQTFPPAIPADKQAILDALTGPPLRH